MFKTIGTWYVDPEAEPIKAGAELTAEKLGLTENEAGRYVELGRLIKIPVGAAKPAKPAK